MSSGLGRRALGLLPLFACFQLGVAQEIIAPSDVVGYVMEEEGARKNKLHYMNGGMRPGKLTFAFSQSNPSVARSRITKSTATAAIMSFAMPPRATSWARDATGTNSST